MEIKAELNSMRYLKQAFATKIARSVEDARRIICGQQ